MFFQPADWQCVEQEEGDVLLYATNKVKLWIYRNMEICAKSVNNSNFGEILFNNSRSVLKLLFF